MEDGQKMMKRVSPLQVEGHFPVWHKVSSGHILTTRSLYMELRLSKTESDIFLLKRKQISADCPIANIYKVTLKAYRDVAEKLKNGYWILFSGCPCQIAALYGFLGNKRRDNEHLITIEVVCHGIANNEALDLHLNHYHSNKIYSFRDKRNNTQEWRYSQCTTIDFNGKKVKLKREEDIFYAIYASWLLDRKSCSNCNFSQINRVADITLADFWGLSNPDYYKKGVSLIIANNAKANDFILQAQTIHCFEESLRTAINGNPNLYTGFKFIQWHPIVMWPQFCKRILPTNVRFNILTNKMPYKLFWAVFKVSTIYFTKLKKKKILKQLSTNEQTKNLLQ